MGNVRRDEYKNVNCVKQKRGKKKKKKKKTLKVYGQIKA
jgi:hypothetical protein